MEISVPKCKVMALKEQVPIRSKILIDNTALEEANTLTYWRWIILHEKERDVIKKKVYFYIFWES